MRQRTFKLSLLVAVWLYASASISAAPCARTGAQQDVWLGIKVDSLIRAARALFENENAQSAYDRVVDEIAGTMKRCQMTDASEFAARYPEFVGYVRALSLERLDDHELGFNVSDQVYFAETQKYVTIPDFLLTARFLKTLTRFETLPQAKALLREMNANRSPDNQLVFFSYESRHLGTPDNNKSFRRLLIVVPGNPAQGVPEKWVQFGLTDPGLRRTRNVSVVAVVPGADRTTNTYFKDYFRTYRRNGSITIKGRWELGFGDDNCVQCHKSGVLPIFPVQGSVNRDELPFVDVVNDRFLSYGPPRFDKYLDTSKFGPGLGSIRPMPISNVASSRQSHRTFPVKPSEELSANTACVSCHHPNGLGSLNWPMDSKVIGSFVKGGQMPFRVELTKRERAKLYNLLVEDYFSIDDSRPGILKSWLLGKNR